MQLNSWREHNVSSCSWRWCCCRRCWHHSVEASQVLLTSQALEGLIHSQWSALQMVEGDFSDHWGTSRVQSVLNSFLIDITEFCLSDLRDVCLLPVRNGGFYCPDSASSPNYQGSASLNRTIKLSVCVKTTIHSWSKSHSVNIESLQTYTVSK